MTRVHIVGAAGYAAGDLIFFLDRHPHVELVTLESESAAGTAVRDAFRALSHVEHTFDGAGSAAAACRPGDVVILAGESEKARHLAPQFLAAGARVIDLSDAFRAGASQLRAVYGLCERYRDQIARAQLVANPGCYPTGALLAMMPLAPFASKIANIVIDAKSGISGAGRSPKLGSMYAEVDGDVRVYGVPSHRHGKEIEQELRALGFEAPFVFTPHVVPLTRGMLVDAYAVWRDAKLPDDAEIRAAFAKVYSGNPFIEILDAPRVPYLPGVAGTNETQIAISVRGGVVHVIAGNDNLGKGAAGQAVQNLNIMCGYPEEAGLGARIPVV
jgi:N-acetyl-gamma-glutamyl-phosphate reductase